MLFKFIFTSEEAGMMDRVATSSPPGTRNRPSTFLFKIVECVCVRAVDIGTWLMPRYPSWEKHRSGATEEGSAAACSRIRYGDFL